MHLIRKVALVSSVVGIATVAAIACSSSSSLPANVPADATPFEEPAGWKYTENCMGLGYLVYPSASCSETNYVLCANDTWSYQVCASTPPAGYEPDGEQETSDAAVPDAGGYPDCVETTCPSCLDLQSCCADGVSLPNAGVCDHTGWDESVCEGLLNKYPACGEMCANGTCTSLADGGESTSGDDTDGGESTSGDDTDGGESSGDDTDGGTSDDHDAATSDDHDAG